MLPATSDDLSRILAPIRVNTRLEAALLTDQAGKVVGVDASDALTPETLDALLAFARRVIEHTEDLKTLSSGSESLFFDWEGRQVVCRVFEAGEAQIWLLVVLSPRGTPYKQGVSRLVKQVQTTLKPAKKPKTPKEAKG